MLLCFDIGTTAVKASLFDEGLAPLAGASEEYRLIAEHSPFVELEPETYWLGMKRCLQKLFAAEPKARRKIKGIAVTTQGETLIPVDEEARPLRNAIVWLDGRAEAEAAAIRSRFGPAEFYAKTGIPDCNGLCPVSKLLWIKKHEPEIYAGTHKFLLLEDYILARLTGRFVTEKSLLSTTGYFDLSADEIWGGALEALGVEAEKLPEPLECGRVVGELRPAVAEELGLSSGVLVATGAMDQTAGALGAGNLGSGIVSETTGTALSIAVSCERPDFFHPSRLTLYRHAVKGRFLYIPICMTAGMVLKWFKEEFCADLVARAASGDTSVYDLMGELAATAPLGANGLILLPYFTGLTQPDNNPSAKGLFFGVGLDTKRPHFIRAIFEGIAFMLRENLELIEGITRARTEEIRSLGGGAKSPLWCQIKADVTGARIASLAEAECASRGAAILLASALGLRPSIESAAVDPVARKTVYSPDSRNHVAYDRLYERYKTLYQRVKDLFLPETRNLP